VRAPERRASRRLAVAAAAVRSVWHAPVVPVALVALVVLACPSGREHPVLVVAVAVVRQPAVPVAPLVRLPPLAVPVAQAAVVAARICCWRHGSRVVRQRAPGWLTVAG
jgi:hypothetical protein